jgi:hypothetical protein
LRNAVQITVIISCCRVQIYSVDSFHCLKIDNTSWPTKREFTSSSSPSKKILAQFVKFLLKRKIFGQKERKRDNGCRNNRALRLFRFCLFLFLYMH